MSGRNNTGSSAAIARVGPNTKQAGRTMSKMLRDDEDWRRWPTQ
jgi:hypothetical protein